MSLWKRGNQYWADFTVDGVRFRRSLGTSKLQEAKKKERVQIEASGREEIQSGPQRSRRLFEAAVKRQEKLTPFRH